jgi:hypothetical protein
MGNIRIIDGKVYTSDAVQESLDESVGITDVVSDALGGNVVIELAATRLASGTASTNLSSGVPLQPGQLLDTDVDDVSLWKDGVEQACYVEALQGRHTDGSVASLLVQAAGGSLASMSSQTGWELRLGVTPLVSRLSKASITFTNGATPHVSGFPAGVLLPTDVDHLIASDWVLPTTSWASIEAGGTFPQRYARRMIDASAYWWANPYVTVYGTLDSPGTNARAMNVATTADVSVQIYDPAENEFNLWIMTANPEYYKRGCAYAYANRIGYFVPNSYGPAPYYAYLTGHQLRYWATGDDEDVTTLQEFSDALWWWMNTNASGWGDGFGYGGEPRPMSNGLLVLLACHRLGLTSRDYDGMMQTGADKARTMNCWIHNNGGGASGKYFWAMHDFVPDIVKGCPAATMEVPNTFMLPQLAMTLIKCVRWGGVSKANVLAQITQLADYAYANLWITNTSGVQTHKVFPNWFEGNACALAPEDLAGAGLIDVTNMWPAVFAWLKSETGTAAYTTKADEIFVDGVGLGSIHSNNGPYLIGGGFGGGKMRCEQYWLSTPYFAWR